MRSTLRALGVSARRTGDASGGIRVVGRIEAISIDAASVAQNRPSPSTLASVVEVAV